MIPNVKMSDSECQNVNDSAGNQNNHSRGFFLAIDLVSDSIKDPTIINQPCVDGYLINAVNPLF